MDVLFSWTVKNHMEVFGAMAGIVYIFFEIRASFWLWPVGIVTSAVYVWVFFNGKLYADMSLQVYYVVISILGLVWWLKRMPHEDKKLRITNLKLKTGAVLAVAFVILFAAMWAILKRFTDSPVPGCDALITSLSVIATWMLARKILQHWFLWIIINATAVILFITRELYPTAVLYAIYGVMSFVGLTEWRRNVKNELNADEL
ncbi:MAG: nicotinamide riboside transporter PnuC [Bacteroidales bacterium]|jgi:nicotinamide mononucleotide transporter|nr:nicotinamide riboside transporter PnuC [Bacteroidales bacterium]